jgi:predicted enzyme related to lactoylglutathione lyase
MTNVEKHPVGAFCWVELGTTDQEAAKKFYQSLFNWKAQDSPMGPGEVYTIFKLDGRDAAAGYTLRQEQRSAGVPPHWMLYIAVANADETTAKVKWLAGNVIMGPFDVMGMGRMSVLQDPTGAHFCIWQPMTQPGIGIANVPGTLCWADLSTPDVKRAADFYSGLLGWKIIADEKDPSGYLHIKNGEDFIGGIPPSKLRQPGVPPHWLPYFQVSDVDATANTASRGGSKLCMPPTSMENVGRLAVLFDPQGAAFAIFKSAR